MVKLGVIVLVTEPTDLVSLKMSTCKSDGRL